MFQKLGDVAQLVELLIEDQGVGGSIPSITTKYAPLAHLVERLCYI